MEEKVNAISQEVALFQSRQLAQNNEVGKQLKKLENDLWAVRDRVKVLEEIRIVQKRINSDLLQDKEKNTIKKPFSILGWLWPKRE